MPTNELDLIRRLGGAEHGLAVVAVARPDGTVHTSLVNAALVEHPAFGTTVAFVSRGDAKKIDYLRAAERGNVVFRSGWEWGAVEGRVEIVPPAGTDRVARYQVPGLLRTIFQAAGGTHDDWDEFDRVMADERRAAVLVHVDRVVTNPGQ